MNKIKVYVLLTLAPVFWGANFHLAKWALNFVTPVMGALIRFVLAAIVLITILPFIKDLPKPKELGPKVMLKLLALGLLGMFLFNYLFMVGLKYTSAVNGSLIMGFFPLLTTLISAWFLGTRMNTAQVAGLVLSLAGVLLVISGGDLNVLTGLKFAKGDVLMIIACLSFAFYSVLMKRWNIGLSPLVFLSYTIVPALLLFSLASIPDWQTTDLIAIPLMAYVSLFIMAALGTVLAYMFWVNGVRTIGADKSSLFANVILLTTVIISLLLGQPVTLAQLSGGVLIIAGVIVPSVRINTLKTAQQIGPMNKL